MERNYIGELVLSVHIVNLACATQYIKVLTESSTDMTVCGPGANNDLLNHKLPTTTVTTLTVSNF